MILEIEEEWGLTVTTTSSGLFCRSAARSRRTLDVLKVRARAALMVSGAVAVVVVLAASRLRSMMDWRAFCLVSFDCVGLRLCESRSSIQSENVVFRGQE